MRTLLAGALALIASAALAADLPGGPYYTAPSPLGAHTWAGPYLGATIGYEWGKVSSSPTRPSGVEGGVTAGYNWQRDRFVFGAEGDLDISAADDTLVPWEFSNPWYGTVRGRGGVAFGNILLFGTAGLAFGELRGNTFGLSESHTTIGWAAGLGGEVALAPRWSAKAEWLYLDLSNKSFSITGQNNGLSAELLRMGVNYHF